MSRIFPTLFIFFLLHNLYGQNTQLPFTARRQLIIDFAADKYAVPIPNYSDPEKVYWPVVIARLHKYGKDDSVANSYLSNPAFTNKHPFHFILVGMARIMAMYPDAPAMKDYKKQYLENVRDRTDSYNAWTCEGTENHINMSRSSGYIFAELMEGNKQDFPDAGKWKTQMKEWIQYYSKRIFEVGTGEFNASTYGIFNVIGWLNLYDFAQDSEVKLMAKAVLDYYASELALHYSWGMTAGAESRGTPQTISCRAETDYLSWLWFGNITKPVDEAFFNNDTYKSPLQAVHAATSTYKPDPLIVALANNKIETPVFYRNSKPSYLLSTPSYIKHFLYKTQHFSLGSAVYPYGAFAGSAYKNVTWKLVSTVDWGSGKNPQMITGGGTFYDDLDGKIRNPWLQCFQHKNVLIQTHKMPVHAENILKEMDDIFVKWDEKWKEDFIDRFSENDEKITITHLNPVNALNNYTLARKGNGVYINTYQQGETGQKEGIVFIKLEKSFLAIRSVYQEIPIVKEGIMTDHAPIGNMAGLILEVGDISDFETMDDFITTILKKTKLNIFPNENKIEYTNLYGDFIEFTYREKGTFTEPIYDWGYGTKKQHVIQTSSPYIQPNWPSGNGHGRVPQVKINNDVVNFEAEWPVYSGKNLQVDHAILKVSMDGKQYIVDYSGKMPEFSPR